jgi:protein-disulfide isomerase
VAWVYRHFPIDQLHPKARHEAVALECANELGGNEKFWQFTDKVYEITPSNNGLDPAELPKIAKDLGLDTIAFAKCLASTKYDSLIESNAKNGSLTGGDGTPWSILITKGGKKYPISGAQPYSVIKQIIESALKNN